VFINEHLTQCVKTILWNAKKVAREKNYRFAWTRDGKVFMKKAFDSEHSVRITSLEDLDKL